jgi:HAD superfamily hydrolase (TIGR01509 family)
MMASLDALLWDVDGTLADTEQDGHRPSFNAAFAAAGCDWHWSRPVYARLLAVGGGRERLRTWMETRDDWPTEARRDPEGWVQRVHDHKTALYRQRLLEIGLPLRPGVERLLKEAAAAGLRQAVVTTSSRAAVAALLEGHCWMAPLFECRVCGEDVVAKKPDPEAYRTALAALGLTADHALALEDSAAGLQAARGAGLAVLITRCGGEPGPLTGAVALVDDLDSGILGRSIGLDDLRRLHARP